jgi:dihydroorotate dehydrogenase (fumarate)
MADLRSNYLGMELANPLIASASPLSRQLDTARHLEDAGAAAIVMYSLFEEDLLAEERRFERFLHHQSLGHGEADAFLPSQPAFQSSLDQYLEQLQSLKAHLEIPVIASLNGVSETGWVEYGGDLQDAGADALEINVYYVAADAEENALQVERRYLDVLAHLEEAVSIPVAIKLSPQFSSPLHFAHHLHQAGADAVVIFNRFYQCDIDLETLAVEPKLELSDPYEALLRVRWAAILRGALDIDISVTGGFHQTEDIVKALLVGSNSVQLCSTLLRHGPRRLTELRQELERWLDEHEYESVKQMQGSLSHRNAADPAAFERESYRSVLESFTPPPGVRY